MALFRLLCGLYFNPRSPYGERQIWADSALILPHFNPRSPYGERPAPAGHSCAKRRISIHAPLTGSDLQATNETAYRHISIHAPLTGSDDRQYSRILWEYISIHAPLTGSDDDEAQKMLPNQISIHAPLTGSDSFQLCPFSGRGGFQSTLPLRGATCKGCEYRNLFAISIHAPLTGSDLLAPYSNRGLSNFNPRSPYGERLYAPERPIGVTLFQSTLPLRGATYLSRGWSVYCTISIHAPLTGSDRCTGHAKDDRRDFNPRSPYGERRLVTRRFCYGTYFNPRSPYGERQPRKETPGII